MAKSILNPGGSVAAQDLAAGYVDVATVAPPASGVGEYVLEIRMTDLDAGHDLYVREERGGDPATRRSEQFGGNDGTVELVEVGLTLAAGDPPVTIAITDAAGLSGAAAWAWRVYEVPQVADVNVTKVNGSPATLDTGGGAGGTGTGTGDFAIDHDGGEGVTVDGAASTTDVLRFTRGATGVDNVEIAAFLKSEYDAGARGAADRKGTTYTGSDGRWQAPLMLDAGTYTILASARGFLARTFTVVVP